eukprot:CAMPEP_0198284134 /NCGR_PEP_ID=MMETSP1449-20131203/3627_1 /TAXON_ID=420275 /ORGANISM="Attheya septentrionalis, Strain CCMP2084" /LENGTH=734 /DNA_ID=CAMNT_0043981051 /DNA_START=148 /DNA_END=2352 /DNA_ORIENTATION=+
MSLSEGTTPVVVKFVPFASTVESSFWLAHGDQKLDVLKLSEDPVAIGGSFGVAPTKGSTALPPRMRLDQESIGIASSIKNEVVRTHGSIITFNTIEGFKNRNKNQLLNDSFLPGMLRCCGVDSAAASASKDTEVLGGDDLSALTSFLCVTHMDLKAHTVLSWFAFPALSPMSGKPISYASPQMQLDQNWTDTKCHALHAAVHRMRLQTLHSQTATGCPPYFLIIERDHEEVECVPLSHEACEQNDLNSVKFGFLDSVSPWNNGAATGVQPVGWTLRNLVAYLTLRHGLGGAQVTFVSYRPSVLRRIDMTHDPSTAAYAEDAVNEHSLLLNIQMPLAEDYQWPASSDNEVEYKTVGWELNSRQKPGPRHLDLTPLLSSEHLAIQASDLNLKLMKWRMIPSLDLPLLQNNLKVLLLGAGTLGCSVARTLLGWGVRDLCFVDNGRVSYSNPVRQNLFELTDCENGGAYKAEASARALKRVAADVKVKAHNLSIPMPGHALEDEAAVETLDQLIQESDVVFLLTDTRESRWLPTVACAAHDTMCINAALGLDSWLVMRHGATTGEPRLGCYFCNDIVAPENSTHNRTLDQQCTVTRPGLAPIASSMAVELMVSMLHHPKRHGAPAPPHRTHFSPVVDTKEGESTALGVMPHQIRGSIVSYTMMTPTVPAFSRCTGCSSSVISEYHKDKVGLTKQACGSGSTFLEDLSGLTEFRLEAEAKLETFMDAMSDDDVDNDGWA